MDHYNVLVLMQKDPATNEFLDTVLSVQMEEGLDFVQKAYVAEEEDGLYTYLHLTTPDVEDWEFYGLFEEYPEDLYSEFEGTLEELEDFNPAWQLRLPYKKEDMENEDLLRRVVKLHHKTVLTLREEIKERKETYVKMAEEES